jgi:N,N'-diacetyllegionaminate synthase
MITAIRNIEVALGDGIKRLTFSEAKNKLVVRKSLVAKKEIRVGEKFSIDNVTAKRPANGLSPMRWDEVVLKVATRNYEIDDLIDEKL